MAHFTRFALCYLVSGGRDTGFVCLAMSLRILQRIFQHLRSIPAFSNLLDANGFLARANLSFLISLEVTFLLPASDLLFLCVLIFPTYCFIVLWSRFNLLAISTVWTFAASICAIYAFSFSLTVRLLPISFSIPSQIALQTVCLHAYANCMHLHNSFTHRNT